MKSPQSLLAVHSRVAALCAGAALLAACGSTSAPASPAPASTPTASKPAASAAQPASLAASASAAAKPAASASAKPSASAEAKPAASGSAQAAALPAKLDVVKLGEGIYGIQAVKYGMNTGFVVGDDGVMTFACNPADSWDLRFAAIRSVTDKPIKWHVNGHTASDDVGCNPDFKKMGATIYGSVKMKEDYEALWPDMLRAQLNTPAGRQVYLNRSTPTPPDVTFADEQVLNLGKGREAHLIYMGNGHTIGDAIAWMPEQKVMFSADLTVNKGHATATRGDSINWQKILDRMIGMAPNAVVTGHGAITTSAADSKEVMENLSTYFTYMRNQVKTLADKGKTVEDIKKEIDLGPYKDYPAPTADAIPG